MAIEDKKQPIIIKKIVKAHGAHHGGSWKVAYADFVTAMMAFFLLLWLLGITDEMQREGISDWFQNPTGIKGPGGASTSMIKLGGTKDIPRGDGRQAEMHEIADDPVQDLKEQIREIERQTEKRQLDELLSKLKAEIETSEELKDYKDQLMLELTPEGLRVQIVDRENRPMFGLGSAELQHYTESILAKIAQVITDNVPNKVSISGHTDATPFARGYIEFEDRSGRDRRRPYSNWELSADRANAARRILINAGMPETQLGRVVGLADSVLFDRDNPRNPVNRRISIVVLTREAADAIGETEGVIATVEAETRQAQ